MNVDRERIIIAICGPTTSGKTETSNIITQLHPEALVYPYDEHDKYPPKSSSLEQIMIEGGPRHWELPELFDTSSFINNITRLHSGLPIILPANSRESIEAGRTTREVAPSRLNIVEGVHILSFDEIRPFYTTTFFLNITPQEMIRRRLARPRSSQNPWDLEEYIRGAMVIGTKECVLPQRKLAQYELDGTKSFEELAEEILRIVGY